MSRVILIATLRAALTFLIIRFSARGADDVAVTLPRDFDAPSLAIAAASYDKSTP
jgi:hypothetical protein